MKCSVQRCGVARGAYATRASIKLPVYRGSWSLTLSAPHRYAVMWKGKSPNKGFQQS